MPTRACVRPRGTWVLAALLLLVFSSPAGADGLERVQLSRDRRGFVLRDTQRPFHPWGHNYPAGERPLLDDMWERDWPAVVADFREMKALGANVVRIHLQFGRLMEAPDRPNRKALERLGRLVELAERTRLYLDVTGLGAYRKADVPPWYDALDETARWEVQARFWEAVAARCARSPAIFCYDLMNEPIVPGDPRKPGEWYSGMTLGGYDFVQFITLDPAGRPREEIARQWIARLTRAIRKHDRRHLITVGLLPWGPKWGHLSGFLPEKVAPELDFVSVHIYPEKGQVTEALAGLKRFAVGKPLVVEETFPLACSASELEQFLLQSRGIASGWMGHYSGETARELEQRGLDGKLTFADALLLDWLRLFRRLTPLMASGTTARGRFKEALAPALCLAGSVLRSPPDPHSSVRTRLYGPDSVVAS